MLIGDALRRSSNVYPDKIAVIDKFGKYFPMDFKYNYRELYETVNRLANGLLSLGLTKGDRIAILSDSRMGYAVSYLASVKAGLVFSPINPALLQDEVAYLIQDSGARAFIVDADLFQKTIQGIRLRLNTVKYLIGMGEGHGCPYDWGTLIRDNPPTEPQVRLVDDDLATLIYTSGTTGIPKGVPLTHRNWSYSAYMFSAEQQLRHHWKWLMVLPLYTSGGTGHITAAAFRGCTLVLSDPEPGKILKIIQDEKIDFLPASPTVMARVVKHPGIKKYDLSSVKIWFTSAAPISAELMKEISKYFGGKFIQTFGTSETALPGLILQPEDVSVEGLLSRRLTSVGKAELGCEIKVVDDEGNEVQPGGVGELLIRGDGVAEAYWNKPEAPDFKDGWWHSGDLVKVDEDGYIYVVDRKKDMILSGGLKIYSREVEDVISTHPGVLLVSVIGVPDDEWGESVKAVIVPKEGVQITEAEIIGYCKARLASYKKPRSVDFVSLSDMPLMGGGYKVLKRELRDRYRRKYEEEKGKKIERWGVV